MEVKYINNCKAVFDFKYMVLFLICLGEMFLGGLSNMINWERGYWFSTPEQFFVGIENVFIWY